MAWQGSRYKTFVTDAQFTPTDANTFQDLYLRPNGILLADLSSTMPLPPLGTIVPYSGAADPSALWLMCDGRAISRTAYAGLFTVLSTTYGAGDGSSTFNIPDMRDRVAMTKGTDARLDAVGEAGGSQTVALTWVETPNHAHPATTSSGSSNDHTHNINQITILYAGGPTERRFFANGGTPSGGHGINQNHYHLLTTAAVGGGAAHNNLQPYLVTTHIIRVL